MSEKKRSIVTTIWEDPWFESLDSNAKLVYLYLITNSKTNMLGVYEVSLPKIAFETKIDQEAVNKIIERFIADRKLSYDKNYIILFNFLKHQNFTSNMKKSAINVYNSLPDDFKIQGLTVSNSNVTSDFKLLSEAYPSLGKGIPNQSKEENPLAKEISNQSEEKYSLSKGIPKSFSEKYSLPKLEVEGEVELESEIEGEGESEGSFSETSSPSFSSSEKMKSGYRLDNFQVAVIRFIKNQVPSFCFVNDDKKYVEKIYKKLVGGMRAQSQLINEETVAQTLEAIHRESGWYQDKIVSLKYFADHFDSIIAECKSKKKPDKKFRPDRSDHEKILASYDSASS